MNDNDAAEVVAGAIEDGVRALEGCLLTTADDEGTLADVLDRLVYQAGQVAKALAPDAEGRDAAGIQASSLTEAVVGMTTGLEHIADAIRQLAQAVAARKETP